MKIPQYKRSSAVLFATAIGILIVTTLLVYGYIRTSSLSQQIKNLQYAITLLSERDELLAKNLNTTDTLVAENSDALLRSNLKAQSRFEVFKVEVNEISDTVETLDKLSRTDPELLQKYSKVFFLNEHYAPERLVEIENKYLYSEQKPELIHALVAPHLTTLLNAAKAEDAALYVKSAYRSFDEQKYLKSAYSITYGAGGANQFSADQGYSEHQLGTTVDFITTGLNGQLEGFEKTQEYQWMQNSAYKYGFVLSYPPNNPSYIFEPWHWRYVGIELATALHDQGKYFYDLEQREIDEYLVNILN